MFKWIWFVILIGFGFNLSCAKNLPVDLDLQDVNLADAISAVAKFLDVNVVISPVVNGRISLHLKQIPANKAMMQLLNLSKLGYLYSNDTLFIAPREELIKAQQTELVWRELLSKTALLKMRIWRLAYANAQQVARLIKNDGNNFLSVRGHLQYDERTNTVIAYDVFSHLQLIDKLIETLDMPIKQIEITAKLISIDSDFERELGVNFSIQSANKKTKFVETQNQFSLAVAKLADGSQLNIKLAALENAGHAELISSPRLFTANQQAASIESGEEVPYQEVSEGGGTAITFKKAVLSLKVTPQVLPGNIIMMQLHINQDRPSNKMVLGVPTISTRQIITNITARNGETIILGGIFEANSEEVQKNLPFVNRIPIIGWLFKQQMKRQNKRELLIFVTPRVIN